MTNENNKRKQLKFFPVFGIQVTITLQGCARELLPKVPSNLCVPSRPTLTAQPYSGSVGFFQRFLASEPKPTVRLCFLHVYVYSISSGCVFICFVFYTHTDVATSCYIILFNRIFTSLPAEEASPAYSDRAISIEPQRYF